MFGLEHNHQYAYGRKVILYTDHKPLVSISRKPLASAPKRLQRLLLCLQQYDAEIRYRPGRELYLADTLSRAYLSLSPTDIQRSETQKEVESIHAVDYLHAKTKLFKRFPSFFPFSPSMLNFTEPE